MQIRTKELKEARRSCSKQKEGYDEEKDREKKRKEKLSSLHCHSREFYEVIHTHIYKPWSNLTANTPKASKSNPSQVLLSSQKFALVCSLS